MNHILKNSTVFACKSGLFLLLVLASSQNLAAQNIPSICLESPLQRWATYLNWIAPNQPPTHNLVLSIQKYNLADMDLNLKSVASNMHKMTGFCRAFYLPADRQGLSCLNDKTVSMRNPQTGAAVNQTIRGYFGVGGNPGPNPGFINLNGVGYTRTAGSGEVHLFKKVGGSEILVVHFDKAILN